MKKSYISLLAIAAMAAVSCAEKEPQMTIGEPVEMTFEASAKTMTKTQLTDENKVIWCESDKISVFDGAANNMFGIINFQENSGAATFQGTAAADATYYAAYPYNAENELSGSTISLTLPASQTATSGTFADGYALAVAKASEGSLAFKNVTALVKVTLAQDVTGIKSISLKGNKDEAIAGTVSVTLGEDGSISSIAPAGETQVTLEGDLKAGNSYYFTIAGDVAFTEGLTFTITLSNDKPVVISSEDAVTMGKGTIIPLFTSLSSDRWTPTLEFGEENSFDYAAEQTFTGERIATAELVSAPEGWTADLTDGIKIIAPAQTAVAAQGSTVVPKGNVVLKLTADNGTSTQVSVPVRLKGINDDNELKTFLDAYGRKNGATRGDITKYLSNSWVVLNSDINAPQEEFTYNAFLAYKLDTPLDGNNKTITATCNGTNGVVCLFQNLATDVRNLKIAGNMSINRVGNEARLAALAASPAKNVTITNVHSSVNLTHYYGEHKGSYCGGLIANAPNNINTTFVNCTVSGDITIKDRIRSCGGIMGTTGEGNTNKVIIRNCEYSGNLSYTCTAATAGNFGRVGGLVGDQARALYIYDSKVSAKSFTANLNSKGVYSIGGIVGNTTAAADTYTMELHLENVTNEADIVINGYNDTKNDKGEPAGKPMEHNFGQIYGNGKEAAAAKKDIIKAYSVTLDGSVTVNIHNWSSTGHYYDEATKTIVESADLDTNRTVSVKATN